MNLLSANAQCQDCQWKTQGKNSMGNSAKHYNKTKHFIKLELCYEHTFGIQTVRDIKPLLQTTMFEDRL